MFSVTRQFINENDNVIEMTCTSDIEGVTVSATSPNSEVNHTWTPKEAKCMFDLLAVLFENEPIA